MTALRQHPTCAEATGRYKVMTVVGTRPEIIKLSRVIAALDRYTHHILVHTGQNYDYELNQVFFDDLEIRRPDYFLDAAGKSPAETMGRVLISADAILAKEKPDAFLVYGDTNSCLAALAAKRHRVPVFHMEAGNRCFDQRVPEEINRKIIDHISDVNMTLTEHARRYLLAEGLPPDTTIKIGSTMKEVFHYYAHKISQSHVIERLGLTPKNYFVVSFHREENVDYQDNLEGLVTSLQALARKYAYKTVVSLHPRTLRRLTEQSIGPLENLAESIVVTKPLGFCDYVKLQQNAFCVVSDSGTLTEESALLGFPAVMLRAAHERPEGMDAGTVVMALPRPDRVLAAVELATQQHAAGYRGDPVNDYQSTQVSEKVVRIIVSYTDYIRRTTWYELPQNSANTKSFATVRKTA